MSGKTPTPVPWPRVQQALRPLTDDELALLERSIRENGVLEAVKLLPDGRIIDGHHRYAVATGLRVRAPRRVLDVDDEQAFRIGMELNAARRQLTLAERSAVADALLAAEPGRSNYDIAARSGLNEKTVRTRRKRTPASPVITGDQAPEPTHRKFAKGTNDDRARAREMASEGRSHADIARTLGYSQSTISTWFKRPPAVDELAKQREQHRLRNEQVWRHLQDLNDRARRTWNDERGAILRAIDEHPEHNLVVALAHATRRTRDIAQSVLDAIDPKLSQAERERMDAFARDSGFG